MLADPRVPTLNTVFKFLDLPEIAGKAHDLFPPKEAKVGEGMRYFNVKGVRMVTTGLGGFIQEYGYGKLIKNFLEVARTREEKKKESLALKAAAAAK